jgi:hypothetical protein
MIRLTVRHGHLVDFIKKNPPEDRSFPNWAGKSGAEPIAMKVTQTMDPRNGGSQVSRCTGVSIGWSLQDSR